MKRYLFPFTLAVVFLLFLLYPGIVFQSACEGLLLWFHTVLPTLFPFFILTGLFVQTNSLSVVSGLFARIFCPLFGISPVSCFAVLGGFLCGYPMGAKIIADLTVSGQITPEEGEYLLSFCNNTSPAFILNFVLFPYLKEKVLLLPSFLLLLFCPVISSFLFRKYYHRAVLAPAQLGQNTPVFSFRTLDLCITNSCESILKVGGYIILFSILSALLGLLPLRTFIWQQIFLPSLELTKGITMIGTSISSFGLRYLLLMFMTSFGGLCAIFQSQCMVQDCSFSLFRYTIEKLITALVTSLLSFLLLFFYYRFFPFSAELHL